MQNDWLTQDTVYDDAKSKIEEVRSVQNQPQIDSVQLLNNPMVDGRSVSSSGGTASIRKSRNALAARPFIRSIGIVDHSAPEERETWYISDSKEIGGNNADLMILPWTHWIGRVANQLREQLERGQQPQTLWYGPEGRTKELPVGPFVDYHIEAENIIRCHFCESAQTSIESGDGATSVETTTPNDDVYEVVDETELPSDDGHKAFALKPIICTLDLDQENNIRGPMSGVFVLIGGPGVGKTSVAIHRIPYLINEQNRANEWDPTLSHSHRDLFFTADSTLIVVWKEHLVPYLRDSVNDLVASFPPTNVMLAESWVQKTLRSYITVGTKKGWTFKEDRVWDPMLFELKQRKLNEDTVAKFLYDGNPLHKRALDDFRNALPKGLTPSLQEHIRILRARLSLPIYLEIPFQYDDPPCSVDGIEQLAESLINTIPIEKDLKPYLNRSVGQGAFFNESQKADLKKIGTSIRKASSEAIKTLTQYTDILFAFYRSEIVLELLKSSPNFDPELYELELDDQQAERRLSSVDSYILLWIIHLITSGGRSSIRTAKPLPLYSHIVIDEAQYYEPILLRLFTDLVKHEDRKGVMTIVGDLEQRISSKGGVMSWSELGLELDDSQIARLVTNYRWTLEVFDFLHLVHETLEIPESLNRPFKWRVDGGHQPEIEFVSDSNSEIKLLCDRVNQIRDSPNTRNWTVVVVVAYADPNVYQEKVTTGLKDLGIPAKWATNDDVRETVDKVIITNCDSIIGLEFDCVCLIGAQELFMGFDKSVETDRSKTRQAWVALTRAKRFLFITTNEEDPVLTHTNFDRYKI